MNCFPGSVTSAVPKKYFTGKCVRFTPPAPLRELKTLQTLKMGASAYLTKETSSKELIIAIQTVLSGQKYLTNSISCILAEEITFKNNLTD